MRRYELMLVLRPDDPDERVQAVLDRTTRQIVAGDGQIVKVAPWGRRRLAYPIDRYREGSYYIVLFEAPAGVIDELERSLMITEERLRHLVVQVRGFDSGSNPDRSTFSFFLLLKIHKKLEKIDFSSVGEKKGICT